MLNKILRTILKVKFENYIPLLRTDEMYRTLNLLKFDDIYRYFLLRFINDAQYKNIVFYEKYFAPLVPAHRYETRGVKINLPDARLDAEKHGTIFNCCKLINELDESFFVPQSKQKLKKDFKKYCIQRYVFN